jgi:hypothetical protein
MFGGRYMKLMIAMFAIATLAMAQQAEKGRSEPTGAKQTMTGCLTKGADQPQHYNFVDKETGKKWTVTGAADLEKHSANHTVELTGSHTAKVFNVTAVKHVSATCEAKGGAAK